MILPARIAAPARSVAGENDLNARAARETVLSADTRHQGKGSITSNFCQCQNFEVLEDQLNTIQGDLSALTSLMKNIPPTEPNSAREEELASEDLPETNGSLDFFENRYIVRDEVRSIDQYHGPCSLYSLCREFCEDPIFKDSRGECGIENDSLVPILLKKLCTDASREHYMNLPSQLPSMTLPPRQFLSTMAGQFFKTADHTTDIFVHSNFHMQMERLYAQALRPVDEAWAACFNMVALLAVGKEQNAPSNTASVQSFISAFQIAINNPRVLLVPRLVNVQALALLSQAAESYSSPGVAELVFAQACLLAKKMGLYQSQAISEGFTVEEVIERRKVFRSLYIRDKNSAICRGSNPWLPSYGSKVSPLSYQLDEKEAKHVPRLELARIQDDVYRYFRSGEVPGLTSSKHLQLVSKYKRRLEEWITTYLVKDNIAESTNSVSLLLSSLATRIAIFRGSSHERHREKAFKDAKASCIILLQALEHRMDPNLLNTLRQLVGRLRPLIEQSSCIENGDTISVLALHQLTASFPLAALFLVAKNVLEPITTEDDTLSDTKEEISLLERLRDCFAETGGHHQAESFVSKLNSTLDTLVRAIRQKTCPDAASTPSMIFNDLGSLQSQSSSCRNSPPPGRPNSPIDGLLAMAGHVDASTSSFLLPFMQPTSAPDLRFAGSMQWSGSYGQQMDSFGRVGKRPRLPSQPDLFDVATAYADSDPFTMFDFLGGDTEFPLFNGDQ